MIPYLSKIYNDFDFNYSTNFGTYSSMVILYLSKFM